MGSSAVVLGACGSSFKMLMLTRPLTAFSADNKANQPDYQSDR